MITITTPINPVMFATELHTLTLHSSESKDVTLSLHVNNVQAFYSVYTPEMDGTIRIFELHKLLAHNVPGTTLRCELIFDERLETELRQVITIIPTAVNFKISAQEYLAHYFMTLAPCRFTALERKEHLYVYAEENTTLSVLATYANSDMQLSESVFPLGTSAGQVLQLDVSPALFARQGKTLLRYEVRAGIRRATFLLREAIINELCFSFLNAFGVPEYFYCEGLQEQEPKFKRDFGDLMGEKVLYSIQETTKYKASTAPLDMGILLAQDFLRSRAISLEGDTINITDCSAKHSSDTAKLSTFTFDYERAQPGGYVASKLPTQPFTNTFDKSFK